MPCTVFDRFVFICVAFFIAVIADRTACDVRYTSYILVWNSCGQHDYLLIYIFKLKSAFDACQLFFSQSLCFDFWGYRRYILQQKCLKKWVGSAVLGTRRYNTHPECHCAQPVTDRQTDRHRHAKSWSYCVETVQYNQLKWFHIVFVQCFTFILFLSESCCRDAPSSRCPL